MTFALNGSKGIRTHNHLVRKKAQPFSETVLLIELCCEYY